MNLGLVRPESMDIFNHVAFTVNSAPALRRKMKTI